MRVGQDLHTKFKKKRKGGGGGGLFMLWRGTRFILFRGKDSTTRQVMWSKGEKVELKCKKPRTAGRKGGLAAKMATALQARGKKQNLPGQISAESNQTMGKRLKYQSYRPCRSDGKRANIFASKPP